MAKRERECEEFEEVSAVVHTSPNAKIHGVVTSLSPMEKAKSCSFFDGEISDGKANMRVFGSLCLLFLCLLRGSVALFALSCSGRSTPALLLHWHWHGRHYAPDRVASSCTSPGLVPSLGTSNVTHTHNAPRDPKCDGYIYIYIYIQTEADALHD